MSSGSDQTPVNRRVPRDSPAAFFRGPGMRVAAVFFLSGFAALLYQVVWQRALYAIIGINLESVTVIVTAFLLGLGLGSLMGGAISARPGIPLLRTFAAIEFGIAMFGFVSLPVFRVAGEIALGLPDPAIAVLVFCVVLVPTLLMGSTLPLLVAYSVQLSGNVGRSVGRFYFVNTAGSAVAATAAVMGLLRNFGESGAVRVAACLNILVSVVVLGLASRRAE